MQKPWEKKKEYKPWENKKEIVNFDLYFFK